MGELEGRVHVLGVELQDLRERVAALEHPEQVCVYCHKHIAYCDYNSNGGICSKNDFLPSNWYPKE